LEKIIHLENLKSAIEKRLVIENENPEEPKIVITVQKIDDDHYKLWNDKRKSPSKKGKK